MSDREIMDKIYEMTPAELSRFLEDNFRRMCAKPLSAEPNESPALSKGGDQ